MTIRANQCRLARALLGWSQKELADNARIGLRLLVSFESGRRSSITPAGMIALEKVLTDQGVVLIEEDGWIGAKIRHKSSHPSLSQEP